MSFCPNCASSNYKVVERGFSKDACKCNNCGKRFTEMGTGDVIFRGVMGIIAAVAGFDSMNHNNHWFDNNS